MKIIQLTAENVKKLKVVDITPKGPLVQVTSKKNGQGKTSVLDSIWWLLGGKDGIQDVPIRAGQKKARIRGNLGDLVVERKFTPSGTTLTVSNADGAVYPSPQAILDGLVGSLSFDPLAFARMKQKDQYDSLKSIAKVDADFEALKAANDADFKRRTDINRDAKAKRAQAAAFVIPPGTPAQRIDETEIVNQIQAAGEHNAAIETRKAQREQAQRDANDKKAEGVRLRNESARIRERAAERLEEMRRQMETYARDQEASAKLADDNADKALAAVADLEKKIDEAPALPAPIVVTELRAKLDAAKVTNTNVSRREQRDRTVAEAEALEKQADELTERIKAREQQKVDAIKAAKMPVDGMGFGDGFVTYNGLPFDQSSDAEQLRVSAEIAMNENPKLRVIRIRDGSLLDDDNLAILAKMAADRDYQIWVEQVDRSGKIGIVMEDGEVVADNQQALPMEVQA